MSLNIYPGNHSNLRKYIRREYLNQYYNLQKEIFPNANGECNCITNKVLSIKQGYLDPNINDAQRISQILQTSVGGRTTFGNYNNPLNVNCLGGIEGQSGGIPRPLRNKF
jgi:hypothetical protein